MKSLPHFSYLSQDQIIEFYKSGHLYKGLDNNHYIFIKLEFNKIIRNEILHKFHFLNLSQGICETFVFPEDFIKEKL